VNVKIVSVPQHKIRSRQVGDWWFFNRDSYVIHVLDTLSPEAQLAVAIHELVEAFLCRKEGITDGEVTTFDDQYEAEREQGKHKEDDEPGDDPHAPYREQHSSATFVERAVCHVLSVNWPKLGLLAPQREGDRPKTSSPEPQPPLSSESPPRHVLD